MLPVWTSQVLYYGRDANEKWLVIFTFQDKNTLNEFLEIATVCHNPFSTVNHALSQDASQTPAGAQNLHTRFCVEMKHYGTDTQSYVHHVTSWNQTIYTVCWLSCAGLFMLNCWIVTDVTVIRKDAFERTSQQVYNST